MSCKAPAKPVALMRAAGLKAFVAFLARERAPVELLLARAKISPEVLERPESLIPLMQALRFMEDVALIRGLENVGARAGMTTPLDALGIFGRQVMRASTLQAAIGTLIRLAPAFDSGGRYWLTRDGDRTWLCHRFHDGLGARYRQADEYWLMIALNVVRLTAGPNWRPEEVRFESAGRAGSVAFGEGDSAIAFSTALLGRPLAAPRLGQQRDSIDDVDGWRATGPANELVESILQLVATLASSAFPRIDTVAHAAGISVRTLQRRLADAGTSYEQALAQARFGMAARLLSKTDATVLNIALDLGYSDHAHFTRAFRRWTGLSPFAYRQATLLPSGCPRFRRERHC